MRNRDFFSPLLYYSFFDDFRGGAIHPFPHLSAVHSDILNHVPNIESAFFVYLIDLVDNCC